MTDRSGDGIRREVLQPDDHAFAEIGRFEMRDMDAVAADNKTLSSFLVDC